MPAITVRRTPREQRIIDLSARIWERYGEDLEHITAVTPTAIKRCARGLSVLRNNNASSLAKVIAVKLSTLESYYNGNIALDDLWEKRGEAPAVELANATAFDQVVYLAKQLSDDEVVQLIKALLDSLPLSVNDTVITLGAIAKKRLKALFLESLKLGRLTVKDIVEQGAAQLVVSDILGNFDRDYSLELYSTLVPFLYAPRDWVDDEIVILDYPNKIESVDALMAHIEPVRLLGSVAE